MKPEPNTTRETRLLLECVRGRPDGAAIQSLVRSGIDWESFLALAETHRLSALAARRLDNAVPEDTSPGVQDELRARFRRNVQRNLFLSGELCRVLERLEAAGVRTLAFKGAVWAWWLYQHPGLRQFQDLDLLVDEQDLERARAVLAEAGYHPETEGGAVKYVPSGGQMTLLPDAPGAAIDLHWELAPFAMGIALNARWGLSRAMTVSIAGRRVLTFGIEEQVLLCALHGGKHGWSNLGWVADLAALIENHELDWARLLAEARRKGLTRALFTGLWLLHGLWATPIPQQARGPMQRDTVARALARKAHVSLLARPVNRSAGQRFFPRELVYEFRLTEGWLRKGRFLWRKITQPSDADWQAQPVTRPFRLMRKYVLRLAGCGPAA